jgi:glycosyltransferase involved in cell wall biosynthesis
VLAPNDASGRHLVAMGVPADLIGIWSRGVEHALFNPARRDPAWRRALGYSDEDVVLLFFGRIVREKGTACFAETVRELRQRGLAVRPLVVGEGPARAELAGQLGEAVFLGHLDGEELGRAVASSDILLNPSLTEAFGNVNLEAMAAGLCVVSANVGSASALITDRKDGYLIDADPPAFADAIVRLANHPATRRRVGRNAVATARAYRWSDVLDDVIRTYRGVTSS